MCNRFNIAMTFGDPLLTCCWVRWGCVVCTALKEINCIQKIYIYFWPSSLNDASVSSSTSSAGQSEQLQVGQLNHLWCESHMMTETPTKLVKTVKTYIYANEMHRVVAGKRCIAKLLYFSQTSTTPKIGRWPRTTLTSDWLASGRITVTPPNSQQTNLIIHS